MTKKCYNMNVKQNCPGGCWNTPEARPKEVKSLSDASVPQGTQGAPERGPAATPAFCELMARDLGVKLNTARTAFLDEPTQRVLGVVGWAMDKSDDPEERARMILAWAKKRKAGAFRPDHEEYVSLAGSVGGGEEAHYRENERLARLLARYWHENPRRLARVLTELEIWINVFPEGLDKNGRS